MVFVALEAEGSYRNKEQSIGIAWISSRPPACNTRRVGMVLQSKYYFFLVEELSLDYLYTLVAVDFVA
jgi:hypothetical protein